MRTHLLQGFLEECECHADACGKLRWGRLCALGVEEQCGCNADRTGRTWHAHVGQAACARVCALWVCMMRYVCACACARTGAGVRRSVPHVRL